MKNQLNKFLLKIKDTRHKVAILPNFWLLLRELFAIFTNALRCVRVFGFKSLPFIYLSLQLLAISFMLGGPGSLLAPLKALQEKQKKEKQTVARGPRQNIKYTPMWKIDLMIAAILLFILFLLLLFFKWLYVRYFSGGDVPVPEEPPSAPEVVVETKSAVSQVEPRKPMLRPRYFRSTTIDPATGQRKPLVIQTGYE
jgi:hypothetical protein